MTWFKMLLWKEKKTGGLFRKQLVKYINVTDSFEIDKYIMIRIRKLFNIVRAQS